MAGKSGESLYDTLTRWMRQGRTASIPEVLVRAAVARYDGQIVIHFRGGIPMKIEAGRPASLELDPPSTPSPADSLDTLPNSSHTARV